MGSIASAPQRRACIVGHTGFVGANLFRSDRFGLGVDTASIHRLEGRSFDLLVCAAPHAKKWWANRHPEEDRAIVQGLAEQLSRADAEHVVLLSTIDVFPRLTDIDDSFDGDWSDNHPYGCHRRELEVLVRESFARVTVVRLPGLFGPGLKKNVLFDLLNQRLLDGIHPDSAFQCRVGGGAPRG